MEEKLGSDDDFAGVEAKYNSSKFDEFLEASAINLAELNSEQKLKIIRRILKMSNFDDTDLYYLGMYELQNSCDKPPVLEDCAVHVARETFRKENINRCTVTSKGEKSILKQRNLKSEKKTLALKPSVKQLDGISKKERLLKEKKGKKPIEDECMMVQKSGKACLKRPHSDSADRYNEENKRVKAKSLVLKPSVKQLDAISKQERLLMEKEGKKPMEDEGMMVGKSGNAHLKRPHRDSKYGNDEERKRVKARPPPELREKIEALNGYDEVLVIQKALFPSDVGPIQGRLSLPPTKIDHKFLKPEEKVFLNTRIGKDIAEIEAELIQPSGQPCTITLKKWDMISSSTYNLVRGWNRVVDENKLCQGMVVQLWSFRVDSKLWFALVKV